ncbi:MAG TPA: hypothetical protein VIL69_11300, partial [Roseomonas sp.]
MATAFTEKQLDNFFKAASSLKLFSRAELSDDKQRSLIERLYVDPLPNEQAFKTLLSDSTTILIGRKGTGKSTVFQRAQHEIRKNKMNVISSYMDIRNVYESSQVDQVAAERLEQQQGALSPAQIRQLLLYKRFFTSLIADIRTELNNQVNQSFLSRLHDKVRGTSKQVFAGLDRLIAQLDEAEFHDVSGLIQVQRSRKATRKNIGKDTVKGGAKASLTNIEVEGGFEMSDEVAQGSETDDAFSEILMRVVNVNKLIDELREILTAVEIKYLYIFLDDFSELPEEAMKVLVDALISPLTRWSDFIKFKIAAYPGRVYLGSLDTTKLEEFHLDIYRLYGANGVNKMEEKTTDFVKRIIERRLQHFCKSTPDTYFNIRSDDIWRVLFYCSMGNPRILGHIMLYAYETHLLYQSKINIQAIRDAAQRYYEEKVLPIFGAAKYRTSFHERSSIYSLKELLESIVSAARSIRQDERQKEAPSHRGRVYSSHFYVSQEFEDLLTSLELSFFVTKYFEQSDREGRRVSVYALNYGLCNKYQISFGRPAEKREDRLYFVERVFDYN